MINIIDNTKEDIIKYYDDELNKIIPTRNDISTPMKCVAQMLQKVPKKLFTKQNITILDPCCGYGNFHVMLYYIMKNNGK